MGAVPFQEAKWARLGNRVTSQPGGAGGSDAVQVHQARRGTAQPIDHAQNKAIREWARSKNKQISDRGRIPEEIVAEYHASAGR